MKNINFGRILHLILVLGIAILSTSILYFTDELSSIFINLTDNQDVKKSIPLIVLSACCFFAIMFDIIQSKKGWDIPIIDIILKLFICSGVFYLFFLSVFFIPSGSIYSGLLTITVFIVEAIVLYLFTIKWYKYELFYNRMKSQLKKKR